MERDIVVRLHTSFEQMVQRFSDAGIEFWCARDLQMLLGYAKRENFAKVIDMATTSFETAGYDQKERFLGIRKRVDLGSGANRNRDRGRSVKSEMRLTN